MSLIIKLPGVSFTDTTLPKLYREAVITPGTKWVYDALDGYSYPSQAAAAVGALWKDLTPNAGDAVLAGGPMPFSGGFVENGSGYFAAPVTGRVASNAPGLLFIHWLKYGTQPTTGYSGISGCFDSNSLGQYGFTINNNASNGNLVGLVNSAAGFTLASPVAGSILQIALSLKKLTDNTYLAAFYKNGVFQSSQNIGAVAIQQPTTPPRIGWSSAGAFANTFVGTNYRALFDDTSTLADQAAITAMVLADYNANTGRFA